VLRWYDIVPLVAATLAVIIAVLRDRRRKKSTEPDSPGDD
jgi:hypothetical protein